MSRRKLGISWIQGQFIAVHISRGKRIKTWESPVPVTDLPGFNQALAAAGKDLGFYRGGDVSIVYESDLISHPLVQTPPMNTRDMAAFLSRKAQQEKAFEEDAAWSYTRTLPSREGEGVVLHLLPKPFVNAIIRICEEFYLYPVSLLPLSDAMALHIRGLSKDADAIGMLVALFPDQCQILVARGDGTILFVRDLGYAWSGNETRLGMEIERSHLFAKQRFAQMVSRIWVSGSGSEQVAEHVRGQVQIPVTSLKSSGAFEWAFVTGTLPSYVHSNMIQHDIQQKRVMRRMMRASAALVFLLVASSIFTVVNVERLVAQQGIRASEAAHEIAQMQQERMAWINKADALEKIIRRRKAFESASIPGMAPIWFVRYVGAIMPEGLVLTYINIQKPGRQVSGHGADSEMAGASWIFKLQGPQSENHTGRLPALLKTLEAELVAPPLLAHITRSWRESWLRHIRQGGAGHADNAPFTIEGAIP